MANTTLSKTYRALQFTSATEPAQVITKPTPPLPPAPGTVLLRPLSTGVFTYANQAFQNGNPRMMNYPLPFVPGPSCIARVAAAPSDAPLLAAGQLVVVDSVVRARDQESGAHLAGENPSFLLGVHGFRPGGPGSRVMESTWRDGTCAEVVAVPVENVHVLDEAVLLGAKGSAGAGRGLGYRVHDLSVIMTLAVPYGGLASVGVRPGDTVLVAPATGGFGGAAVHVALAMGARVIAMGRNETVLAELEETLGAGSGGSSRQLATVKLSGSVEGDLAGIQAAVRKLGSKAVDVFLEMSPPMVTDGHNQTVPYITAGVQSLGRWGRMALMGGAPHHVSLPFMDIMHLQKTIQGCWMYTPTQLREVIRLVEMGILKIGEEGGFKCCGVFPLEEWEEAFETAAREGTAGHFVVLQPNKE